MKNEFELKPFDKVLVRDKERKNLHKCARL